jgi:hypothetical protein
MSRSIVVVTVSDYSSIASGLLTDGDSRSSELFPLFQIALLEMNGPEYGEAFCEVESILLPSAELSFPIPTPPYNPKNEAATNDDAFTPNSWDVEVLLSLELSSLGILWELPTEETASAATTSVEGSAVESVVSQPPPPTRDL